MTRDHVTRVRRPQKWIGAFAGLAMATMAGPSIAQQGVPPAAPPIPEPSPVGTWIDHTGRGAVEILPCGTELCGRIVWLQTPTDKRGQPLRDALNPQAGLRTRPICGLPIIGSLKRQRDGSWDNGWIYDPEKGEQFDVELRLRGPDTLQVKGYLGVKFLSETFTWRRATAPIQTACAAG